jgi:hypothetical protein
MVILPRRAAWRAVLAVAAGFVGWMSGCADSHSRATLAEGCTINTDCNSPLVCAFQRCHAACKTSRDCDLGQRCVASDRPFHVCQLASESQCDTNSNCGAGQICGVDKQCRDACVTARDCVMGQLCVSATCADPAELDSEGGLTGAERDASVPANGLPCSFNSDCPSPLLCRAGTCSAECRKNGDCAAGLACENSRCIAPLACAVGDAGTDPRAGGPCLYSSQCPPPLACVSGYCSCECLATQDCAPGFACVNNRCEATVGGANALEIGPRGGTITSSDGNLSLTIPAGAVDSSILFSVRTATAWPSGAVGSVYEVDPSGTKFTKPATIALSYGGIDLGSLSPDDLLVENAVGSGWQSLGTAVNDTDAKTVASTTSHLSVFGLVPSRNGVGGSGNTDSGAGGASSGGRGSFGGGAQGGAGNQGGIGGQGGGTAGAGGTVSTDGSVTISALPITLQAGAEVIECQDFANPFGGADVAILSSQSAMGPLGFEIFLYDDPAFTQDTALTPCQVDVGSYVHFGQQGAETTTYPAGVGRVLLGTNGLRMLLHYRNTGRTVVTVNPTVTLQTASPSSIQHHARELFLSNFGFAVPPQTQSQTVAQSFTLPFDIALLSAVDQVHQYGTSVSASTSVTAAGPFYTADGNRANSQTYTTPRTFKAATGITWACIYSNPTAQTIGYGDQVATGEKCIFAGTFYPLDAANADQPLITPKPVP